METTEGCAALANIPCSEINLVVCNAGVLTNDDFSSINFSDCAWQFNTNALGPLRAVQSLLPKLLEGSKIILIGSKLGSFGETIPGRRVRASRVRSRVCRPRANSARHACVPVATACEQRRDLCVTRRDLFDGACNLLRHVVCSPDCVPPRPNQQSPADKHTITIKAATNTRTEP